MSETPQPASQIEIPPDRLIDPFDFRAVPVEFEDQKSIWNSDYIGDQLSEHPDMDVFLESKQRGGKLLNKDEYLTHELMYLIEIQSNENLPLYAREYFENSESFNAIFENKDADGREILDKTEKFLMEHGDYCRSKLIALQERVTGFSQEFKDKVLSAVNIGDLPPQAAQNLELLERINYSVTDVIFAGDNDSMLGGYYLPRKQAIGVSIFLPDSDLREVVFHESMHAISGHTIVRKYDSFTQVERTGFPNQNGLDWAAWLDEAITQHLTSALLHGRFDIILPEERAKVNLGNNENEFYFEERTIFGLMVHPETSKLTLNDFLKVYFAHRKEGSNEYALALRELIKKDKEDGYSLPQKLRILNHHLMRWKSGESVDEVFGPNE